MDSSKDLDLTVRHFVYQQIVQTTTPPTAVQTAERFGLTETQAKAAYQRLHDSHFFFLEPNTSTIRMANPFSAVPTNFKVTVKQKTYWANCAWDMLGIPAALGQEATIEATCSDTAEIVQLGVENDQIRHTGGVVHFPLPIQQWYEDLILT